MAERVVNFSPLDGRSAAGSCPTASRRRRNRRLTPGFDDIGSSAAGAPPTDGIPRRAPATPRVCFSAIGQDPRQRKQRVLKDLTSWSEKPGTAAEPDAGRGVIALPPDRSVKSTARGKPTESVRAPTAFA